MTRELAARDKATKMEMVLISGDLSQLSPEERVGYYNSVCDSVGLNPLTKPFEYIKLNGKLVLYAKRDATDQLRKIHKVSIKITSREKIGDVYVVTARASMPDGREDESTGAVALSNLKGEALANLYLKAETKAKRRVTLSICGMGFLDESEVNDIPEVRRQRKAEQVQQVISPPQEMPEPDEEFPFEVVEAQTSSDYEVPFGKYKGKRLSEIETSELAQYVTWIQKKAHDDKKEIRGQVAEFISAADEYLKS